MPLTTLGGELQESLLCQVESALYKQKAEEKMKMFSSTGIKK